MKSNRGTIEAHSALVLAHLIEGWGLHFARKSIENDERELSVYGFYDGETGIVRLATVGLSYPAFGKEWIGSEIYLAACDGNPNAFFDRSVDAMLSLAVHKEKHPLRFKANSKIVSFTKVEESVWNISRHSVVLITEAVGESESWCRFRNGFLQFEMFWVVPVYEAEVSIIQRLGTDMFFRFLESAGKCELHLDRPALSENEIPETAG